MAAFIANPLPLRTRAPLAQRTRRHACTRRAPAAVQAPEGKEAAPQSAIERTPVRAPVVDSRVAGVHEAHHWVTVRAEGARAFERAAAANASVTALVEQRAGRGASRRWVLRRVSDPALGFVDGAFDTDAVAYVVMEAYSNKAVYPEQFDAYADDCDAAHAHTQRWLSAVRRTSRALGALDIRSLRYNNIFTARAHRAAAPDGAVVVIEAFNVDTARAGNLDDVRRVLRSTAESAVAAGHCVHFGVLEAKCKHAFFKTVEVYRDVAAMRRHREGFVERAFVRRTRGKLIGEHRERQVFRPVLFA